MSMVESIHMKKGSVSIIDLGGSHNYWKFLPDGYVEKFNLSIKVLNLRHNPSKDSYLIKGMVGDARDLSCFNDKSFDIAHSNSLIEHLTTPDQIILSKEVQRIACSYYVQTPNFWFPVEPHYMCPFMQWMPVNFRTVMLNNFDMGNLSKRENILEALTVVSQLNLIDEMRLQWLFPAAEIVHEKFMGLTKSLIAMRYGEI